MLFLSCVCHAFASVHCCLMVTCWEQADRLAIVLDVILCFCYFPMCYPGSGVELVLLWQWAMKVQLKYSEISRKSETVMKICREN